MIRHLKGYALIAGNRGSAGVDENLLKQTIQRLSALVQAAPEIMEVDINPLMGSGQQLVAVDARVRLVKSSCGI